MFNIGVKVRILRQAHPPMFAVGTIGTVINIDNDFNIYAVKCGKVTFWYMAEELELVKQKPEQKRHRLPHSKIANRIMRQIEAIQKMHISNPTKIRLIKSVAVQYNIFD